MYKYLFIPIFAGLLVVSSSVLAVTKPSPDANFDSLSYNFYLYYDNGQIFADRDYAVKYDIVSAKFVEASPAANAYKLEISNFKSEVIKTVLFDPKHGDFNFVRGKITVKAPYTTSGMRASFYDNQNRQLVTIFINETALCNDNNSCNSAGGENETTCPSDCGPGKTPRPTVGPTQTLDEGPDILTIVLYAVGGLAVAVGAWFGWRWWKNKKEESFSPPPSTGGSPPLSVPPLPPSAGL
ncbi:MAG: hypothetical protein A3B10_00500 [Candidatus Doudnabacteria bacterium RIFCSPLOWO2_01_FULL_44_21]|uniref:Cohesin domain-containing protein n=1 Tax=Candidatus Doudnabacteria bacterium RIFCSPLOWO2_01_FULL_44_21 TaxID=1817841 RepID=A0A1F5PXI4_9BACT|nr:MAG: hypothetical protein A3B10_00500 [Candidatus Doudnabacteria bacterium RIFCSPLOWO2_01_FULL_44_21]